MCYCDHAMRNIRLDWEGLGGVTSYRWQLDSDGDFTTVPSGFEDETGASSAPLPALEPATTYYWRVRVTQPVLSRWSEKWAFTTSFGEAVSAPVLIGPVATQNGVSRKPIFQWQAVAGAEGYELVAGTDASLSSPVISRVGDYALPSTAWESNITLDYGTTYYWKVRAISARTRSTWSTASAFTTEASASVNTPVPSPTSEAPKERGFVRPSPELPPAPPQAPVSYIPEGMSYLIGALATSLFLLVVILLVLVLKLRRF